MWFEARTKKAVPLANNTVPQPAVSSSGHQGSPQTPAPSHTGGRLLLRPYSACACRRRGWAWPLAGATGTPGSGWSLLLVSPAPEFPRSGRSPSFISPPLTPCRVFVPRPAALCPAPPRARAPASAHGAAGAAELGGGLPQDPVSLPRGAEPGFRLWLWGVPPGGAQFKPEGEPGPEAAGSHDFPFRLSSPPRALELPVCSAHCPSQPTEDKLRVKVLLV